jgi:hypothetical protein
MRRANRKRRAARRTLALEPEAQPRRGVALRSRSIRSSFENARRSRRANAQRGLTPTGAPTKLRAMRPTRWLALALLAVGVAAFAEEQDAPARIYRWVDENGIAHYTTNLERVPEELRDQPLRREEVSAQAPAAIDAWVQRERIPDAPQLEASRVDTGASDRLTALNARIAELEQAIAADEALLAGDLTAASEPTSNEALKQVAERMPERIAELKKLKAERDALAPASAE